MNLHPIRTALAAAALCAILPAAADDCGVKLGSVHFKVGCNAAAQREFDLAMAYYHSFAWSGWRRRSSARWRPMSACGMVHWARGTGLCWTTRSPGRPACRPRRWSTVQR